MNLNFSFFCHNIQIMSSFSSSSSPATGSATSGSGSINHNKRRRVWNNDSDEDHDEDDDADPREEECYCYGLRMPSWHHDGKFCVRADLLLLITKMVAVALCESIQTPACPHDQTGNTMSCGRRSVTKIWTPLLLFFPLIPSPLFYSPFFSSHFSPCLPPNRTTLSLPPNQQLLRPWFPRKWRMPPLVPKMKTLYDRSF